MPKSPQPGEPAPDFVLPGVDKTGRREFLLSEERGRPVVLAFYPGDDTPVCTKQLCSYQDELGAFDELDATVWGISPQNVDSHEKFAARRGLAFPLLADVDRVVATLYGVNGPFTIKRSVFVVDAAGIVRWSHASLLGLGYQSVATITGVLRELART